MRTKIALTCFSVGFLISLAAATGCSDGGGGGGGGGGPKDPNAPKEFASSCGTILDGILQNPVKVDRAEVGFASFSDTNTVSFMINGESRRVKLIGVEDEEEDADNSAAEDIVSELIKEGPVFFFRATKDCVFKDPNGFKTFKGQIFSYKGKSFAEELVAAGAAVPGGLDCNAHLVKTCYKALSEGDSEDDGPDAPVRTPVPTGTSISDSIEDIIDESEDEDEDIPIVEDDEELDPGDF